MNYDTQETTITIDQQHELQALVEKYAGGDLKHANKELREARRRVAMAKDIAGKNAIRREYITGHGEVDEADRNRVRELMRSSHQARHANVETAGTLKAALDEGWIDQDAYGKKLREEERRVIREQQATARDLLKYLALRSETVETFEATATDKEVGEVVDRFNKFAAFEDAKQRYREMYDGASIEAKVRMKQENRELHQAVFGR